MQSKGPYMLITAGSDHKPRGDSRPRLSGGARLRYSSLP